MRDKKMRNDECGMLNVEGWRMRANMYAHRFLHSRYVLEKGRHESCDPPTMRLDMAGEL